MKNIIYLFVSLTIFSSCEDVIDMDLNSIEPKLVVEGYLKTDSGSSEIQLTKTTDYFNPEESEKVSGASVVITGDSGESTTLKETVPGMYKADNLEFRSHANFMLSIVSEGMEYSAEIQLPARVAISSVSFEPTPSYLSFSGGYLVSCQLTDPAGIDNFYRYKVYKKNTREAVEVKFNVFDDAFADGNNINMRWEEKQFFPGDTVIVELRSIDKASYDYYMSVNALLESGFVGSASPANPTSNMNGDALGIFGAYTVSVDTLIIP